MAIEIREIVCDGPLESIIETSSDAVFITDLRGRVLRTNDAAVRLFGWSRDELVGGPIERIIPQPGRDEHQEHLANFDPDRRRGHVLGVGRWLEGLRKDGSLMAVEVAITPFEDEGEKRLVGFIRDISERRAVETRLRDLAVHDAESGLLNGRGLIEAARIGIKGCRSVALVAIALRGVWRIGERHGRQALSHVLRTVALRLRAELPAESMLGRVDGELFAVVTDDDTAEAVAQRLRAALIKPVRWGSVELYLAPAIGVVRADPQFCDPEAMLQAAYTATGHALARANGDIVVLTTELRDRFAREGRMEERLRAAVAEGGLSLALQAKVEAGDGRIMGAEALVRWHDAEFGSVPPSEFIPLAERSGIIGDLSAWVFHRSLAEAAAWRRAGHDLEMAINISAVDLRQPDLPALISDGLERAQCDPWRVAIEVTETAIGDEPVHAAQQLAALKGIGVTLALDDFGTGYSSLSRLRRFPIDTLKIDRSFVIDTPDDSDAVAIARTIVALAGSLGMQTVAEGVETMDQAEFLRDLGVDILQGYLYSRPVVPERFAELAAAGRITPTVRSAVA